MSIATTTRSRRIDVAELMAEAAAQTGLDDYGDRQFVEPLERFVASVDAEGNLGELGVEAIKADLTRLLSNRLAIQAAVTAHPEILDEDVSDPIVVTGLPRTGTTKLQRVLAANPNHQKLLTWQALFPAPIAAPGTEPDPRISLTEEQVAITVQQFPELMAVHRLDAHEPEEDMLLLQLSFRTQNNGFLCRAPSYMQWVERQDQTPAYADHRRALQYLQWQDGGRRGRPWVLKAPIHLGALDLIFHAYPAATVVHCHRDLHEVVPSTAHMLELLRLSRGGADYVDHAELGRLALHLARMWSRNLAERAHLDQDRILDVDYESIRDDIESVLFEIYASRGDDLDEMARTTMTSWEETNPQHRHGKHVYSLERYGLTRAEIDAAFAEYLQHFPSRAATRT